jgi:predicted negative regulator of RcsB-dependent stress response
MKSIRNQFGSSHLVVLLLVAVLAVVGFAGFRVMQNQNATSQVDNTSPVATTASVPSKISNKAQAQQAGKVLDAESIDKTLDSTTLDNDLNSVL